MRACGRLARLEAKRQETREFSSQTTQLHFQRAFTLPLFHYTPVRSAVKVPGSVPSTVGDRYKALRHSLSPEGTHPWGHHEQTGHHRRRPERYSENVPDDQCVGGQSTVDIDVGSGVRQNWVQVLKTFPNCDPRQVTKPL